MGTEKPDDNKGKGKSILESNDPINPIGKEKPPSFSTPPGTSNLQSDAYAGQSSASGSKTSMLTLSLAAQKAILESTSNIHSKAYAVPSSLPSSATSGGSSAFLGHTISTDNQIQLMRQAQTAPQQNPIIAGTQFPPFISNQVQIGDTLLYAHYELVRVSTQQLPSYGNMTSPMTSLQGQQSVTPLPPSAERSNIRPVITNQTPILYGTSQQFDPWGGTHKTGPSHGSVPVQAGNILPGAAADNITGQGSIPQSSNILGKRERERSPPVGSMPWQGHFRYTDSSTPSNTESSSPPVGSMPYGSDSQTPSNTESQKTSSSESLEPGYKQRCMSCERDVNEPPVSTITVLSCRHVFHEECLKKFTPNKDRADNPLCIVCFPGEP